MANSGDLRLLRRGAWIDCIAEHSSPAGGCREWGSGEIWVSVAEVARRTDEILQWEAGLGARLAAGGDCGAAPGVSKTSCKSLRAR